MKLAFGVYSYLETIIFFSTTGDVFRLATTKKDVTVSRTFLLVGHGF